MIRYILDKEIRYLYESGVPPYGKRDTLPNLNHSDEEAFVNILEYDQEKQMMKLKVFYADGRIFSGWCNTIIFPVKIWNKDELFDGRFNQ